MEYTNEPIPMTLQKMSDELRLMSALVLGAGSASPESRRAIVHALLLVAECFIERYSLAEEAAVGTNAETEGSRS